MLRPKKKRKRPPKSVVSIRLSTDLQKRLVQGVKKSGKTRTALITEALQESLPKATRHDPVSLFD